ncbi:probable serine/threonine-protein kinase dyrk2 [Uranotaenia lowii]|uniref:probable serine/threonine-protein kinase dyrk2 n=1 Tax=Uranotaenia lowii TaxID=190385 RepID=UPI00247B2612|nr:probable serine/threonine-protein kinase dyrk2 [Uranotaenia lowii]
MQYDDSTRAMWEDLQKPYGNQSSFLRHLILLEKYFRNGDLILSPQAKSNAATYSEAVQNRLRSFDNVPTPPAATVLDKSILLQQLGNAPITITATAKSKTKSTTEPVSLLKSNNPHLVAGLSTGESSTSQKRKLSTDTKSKTSTASCDSAVSNKVMKLDETASVSVAKPTNLVPPELISINAKQNVTITTIPAASKSQTSTTQSSQPVQAQQSLLQPQTQPQQSLLQPQLHKKSIASGGTREIIKLPDTLTEAERRETLKPWRPTLIPITPGSAESIKSGPLYQTADGRRLPKLVQVMSGGKPYHISINDYNRMCILRREKLLQQQQQMLQQQIQQHQKRFPQQSPPNINTLKPSPAKQTDGPLGSSKLQIPNQILEQNSLIPISNNGNTSASTSTTSTAAKTNGPSSELQQLIKTRKPNSTNTLPPTTSLIANTLKSLKDLKDLKETFKNSIDMNQLQLQQQQQQQQNQQSQSNVSSAAAANTPSLHSGPSQLDQFMKSNSQFLSNLANHPQLSAMVAAAAAAAANAGAPTSGSSSSSSSSTSQKLPAGSTSGGSILMDNQAAQLLSKIPKSLTVIPQQKQRSLSRVSSNEDQSSA